MTAPAESSVRSEMSDHDLLIALNAKQDASNEAINRVEERLRGYVPDQCIKERAYREENDRKWDEHFQAHKDAKADLKWAVGIAITIATAIQQAIPLIIKALAG